MVANAYETPVDADTEIMNEEQQVRKRIKMEPCHDNGSVSSANCNFDKIMDIEPKVLDLDCQNQKFEHLKGHHILTNIIDSAEPTDVILSLNDGRIGAHRIVLASCSSFLREVLADQEQKIHNIATIILPDIKKHTMKVLLTLAYTGKMFYSGIEEKYVLEAMDVLKIAEFANLNLNVISQEIEELPQISASAQAEYNSATSSLSLMKDSTFENEPRPGPTHEDFNQKELWEHGRRFHCQICNKFCGATHKLLSHVEKSHKEAWRKFRAPDMELQALTFCNFCGKQLKSIEGANKCLAKHNLQRCYMCLDAITKSDWWNHYETHHSISSTSEGDGNEKKEKKKFLAKCRWCNKLISFSTMTPSFNIYRHCSTLHFQESHLKNVRPNTEESKLDLLRVKYDIREMQVVVEQIPERFFQILQTQTKDKISTDPVGSETLNLKNSSPDTDTDDKNKLNDENVYDAEYEANVININEAPLQLELLQDQINEVESMSTSSPSSDDEFNSANCTTESESESEFLENLSKNNEIQELTPQILQEATGSISNHTSYENEPINLTSNASFVSPNEEHNLNHKEIIQTRGKSKTQDVDPDDEASEDDILKDQHQQEPIPQRKRLCMLSPLEVRKMSQEIRNQLQFDDNLSISSSSSVKKQQQQLQQQGDENELENIDSIGIANDSCTSDFDIPQLVSESLSSIDRIHIITNNMDGTDRRRMNSNKLPDVDIISMPQLTPAF